MNIESWPDFLVGMLVGIFTGAAGKYFADKYTDKRRGQEKRTEQDELFESLWQAMPDLLKKLKSDLEKNTNIREIFAVPTKSFRPNTGGRLVFILYDSAIEDLKSKLMLLENHELLRDETTTNDSKTKFNVSKFRIAELFVALVRYQK